MPKVRLPDKAKRRVVSFKISLEGFKMSGVRGWGGGGRGVDPGSKLSRVFLT